MRYVDDTLLLVIDKNINYICKGLNSFDKNIKFTVDTFPNGNIHFLDIKVDKNHTDIESILIIFNLYIRTLITVKYQHHKSII